jgi:hypothetical protein
MFYYTYMELFKVLPTNYLSNIQNSLILNIAFPIMQKPTLRHLNGWDEEIKNFPLSQFWTFPKKRKKVDFDPFFKTTNKERGWQKFLKVFFHVTDSLKKRDEDGFIVFSFHNL